MQVEFRSHFFGGGKCVLWAGKYGKYGFKLIRLINIDISFV